MDIVERLRSAPSEIGTMTEAIKNMREAADEIERLREALQLLLEKYGCGSALKCEICDQARAALKESE